MAVHTATQRQAHRLLILASASPRRRELLRQIGVPHRAVPADIDERRLPGESIEHCVERLAKQKARRVFDAMPPGDAALVLAADTVVVLGDCLLGKPADRAEALGMLRELSGRVHRVLTAVALQSSDGVSAHLSDSEVRFRALREGEAERYWDTGEPRDKAGAYAIQGFAAAFIAEVRGSYSGVMGLPLFETAELLQRAGFPLWQELAG
jgi:septum formation protein